MKCILHIGTEKTGTTLLQNWLYANRERLLEHKVGLTEAGGMPNNRKFQTFFRRETDEYFTKRGLLTEIQRREHFIGFPGDFMRELAALARVAETVIITSEHFHSRIRRQDEIEELRSFLLSAFDEVVVVCYFREQSEMCRSLYSTALRVGFSETIEQFCKRAVPTDPYYNHHSMVTKWAGVFGKNNLRPILFHRLKDNDIRRDFITRFAPHVPAESLDYSRVYANETFSALQAEIARMVNEVHRNDNRRSEIIARIERDGELKVGTLVNPHAGIIYDAFDASNTAFGREFLDHDGNPFPLPKQADTPRVGLRALAFRYVKRFAQDHSSIML